MRRCGHDYHCFMIFFLISSDNILLPAFRLQLACAQGGHVTVKSFGRLFPVSWLCFTTTFFTLPSKSILCSYVVYPYRCFSPLQLYYLLRLSPSLKTRRRHAAGVGGWPPLFYDVSIPLFFTEASGLWSDTNHYICMVLFCILNELKHLAYAMMTYFSLTTIQFCFPRFTAICKN